MSSRRESCHRSYGKPKTCKHPLVQNTVHIRTRNLFTPKTHLNVFYTARQLFCIVQSGRFLRRYRDCFFECVVINDKDGTFSLFNGQSDWIVSHHEIML